MTAYLIACACWFVFGAIGSMAVAASQDGQKTRVEMWTRLLVLCIEVLMASGAIALLMGKS